MSEIQVYGHGLVSVDTQQLHAAAAQLRAWVTSLLELNATMLSCESITSDLVGAAAPGARDSIAPAAQRVGALGEQITRRATALEWVADHYENADRFVLDSVSRAVDAGAWGAGRIAGLVALANPVIAAAGFLMVRGVVQGSGTRAVSNAARANPRTVANPIVPAIIRLAVSGSDGAIAGLLGLPPGALQVIGSGDQAQRGQEGAARVVGGAGTLGGAFVETPVRAVFAGGTAGAGPRSLEGLLERVPATDPHGPQVRIDAVGSEADPRWIVYLGGTVDTDAAAGGEAFDMTSNVAAMADANSGSERAALDAMRQAGIGSHDPVLLVGYSQGGLVAARLAESPAVNAEGLVSIGSPITSLETGVPTIEFAHSDDVIPALGGFAGTPAPDRVVVVREAFAGREPPAGDPLAAHHLPEYRVTAGQADRSNDRALAETLSRFSPYLDGGDGTSTYWGAERVSPDGGRPTGGGSLRGLR